MAGWDGPLCSSLIGTKLIFCPLALVLCASGSDTGLSATVTQLITFLRPRAGEPVQQNQDKSLKQPSLQNTVKTLQRTWGFRFHSSTRCSWCGVVPLAELTLMLSSESGLVDTTLLLLLSEHDCVMLLLF